MSLGSRATGVGSRKYAGMVALALALAMASCAKTPQLRTPEIDVRPPDRWQAADAPDGPVRGQWWSGFGDERLEELVAEALNYNYSLKAAAERVEAAAARARIAGAPQIPAAGAGGDGSRRRQNFIGFPIPGQEDRVLSTTSSSVGVSLDVSWEADLWRRIRDQAAAALADEQASRSDLDAARQSLAAQVAKAWFAVCEARQQVLLTERTLESYRESADRLRLRYESGLIRSLDLRLALTNVHQAEALLQTRRNQLQAAARQLEILLGRYPAGVLEKSAEIPEVPPIPGMGAPSELLSRRPDLLASEWRLAAADERLAAAGKELYPRINFSTSAGTSGREALDVFDPDLFVWNLIGNLTAPVFQGGRIRGNIRLNEARLRELAYQFANDLLTAFFEVETALAAERLLADRESALADNLEQTDAALNLAEFQYENGVEPYITVLESQRRALAAETDLIAIRARRLENRVDLHLALGGSFQVPEPPDPSRRQAAQETQPR